MKTYMQRALWSRAWRPAALGAGLTAVFLCLLAVPVWSQDGSSPPGSGEQPAQVAGQVPVGLGSYTDQLPAGQSGPSVLPCANGNGTIVEPQHPATPTLAPGFQGPVQTHDWWSSIVWKANNTWNAVQNQCDLHSFSENLHPHPWGLDFMSQPAGNPDGTQLIMGYTGHYMVATDQFQGTYRSYLHDLLQNFAVSFRDGNGDYVYAPDTRLQRYSDWDVTAYSSDGNGHTWRTTMVEGSPFVYFQTENIERIEIRLAGLSSVKPVVQQPSPQVLGLTQLFSMAPDTGMTPNPMTNHFGFFTTGGAIVNNDSGDGNVLSIRNLPANGFAAIAVLPDGTPETLAYYRARAYALPIATHTSWQYDQGASTLTGVFSVTTQLMDPSAGNLTQTLQGLYRHQWLNLAAPSLGALTPYTYSSVVGEMKVFDGNVFSTTLAFDGVLPVLPNKSASDPAFMAQLKAYLEAAPKTLPSPDSYFNGKEMARLAELARIADAAGYDDLRDGFIAAFKPVLEDWLTYSGSGDTKFFYRDATWQTMIAYQSSFFSDSLLNDHHFHYGYFLMAAAALAQFDPAWAQDSQWGGMVKLKIKDVANGDRSDSSFPFLRFFDPYAGHNWANGPANAGDGNNQESSSEAINFANGLIQWGEAAGDDALRDLGVFLYATETEAAHQYWFDVDEAVIPHAPATSGRSYVWKSNGIVWGGKGSAVTYFGASAACVVGINVLPVTAGSLYLGRYQDHIMTIYGQAADAYDAFQCWAPPGGSGQPPVNAGDNWAPILWQYLSLRDPISATAKFTDTVPWMNDPSSGTSPAQVYYWLHNMQGLGAPLPSAGADHAHHTVFSTPAPGGTAVEYTYVAYNPGDTPLTVTFGNGITLTVPPGETGYRTRVEGERMLMPLVGRQ